MSIPFIVSTAIATISSAAAIANKAGQFPRIENHKTKVRALALASIALTAALYKGVTFASVKALGNRAVSFMSSNKLKSAGALATAALIYGGYKFTNKGSAPTPEPKESEGK